jgi:YesN/AraC family two-component response regulator
MADFKPSTEIHADPVDIQFPVEAVSGRFDQFVSSLESLGKMKIVSGSFSQKEDEISKLYIKNMISSRCIIVVKAVLEHLGLHCIHVELGEAYISGKVSREQLEKLNDILLKSGLELIRDKREILVGKIKNVLIEMIQRPDDLPKLKISSYLSDKLNYNYTYLANVFSETTHGSIRQFIIDQRIEQVKKMMTCENLTLSEIAHKLNYSSVGYLSKQFKKNAGQKPSHFKKMKGLDPEFQLDKNKK